MEDTDTIAKRHFMLAESFLQLVENILIETVEIGNVDIYIGPPKMDIQEHFRQMTKWSDFRILVPTLFNLFHGLELLMKAANYRLAIPSQKPNHKLATIFCDFKLNYPNSPKLTKILDKYVYPIQANTSLLKVFYLANGIPDSSQFYEIFRYPFQKDFQKDFDYKDLRSSGKEGMIFFKQIIEDIRVIMKEIKEL